jgi:hypothetical protein
MKKRSTNQQASQSPANGAPEGGASVGPPIRLPKRRPWLLALTAVLLAGWLAFLGAMALGVC